jgi:hypothetical protein
MKDIIAIILLTITPIICAGLIYAGEVSLALGFLIGWATFISFVVGLLLVKG